MTEGVNNNNNIKANLAMYAAMPAMTLTLSAGHGIKDAKGIKNAIKLQNREGFKNFYNSLDGDVFTNSIKLSEEYDKHKQLVKDFNKWNNKAKAIKNGKLGLKDRFFNLFKKGDKKLTKEIIEANQENAQKALKDMNNALDSAKAIDKAGDTAKGIFKVGKITKDGLKSSAKSLFKKELKSKFNIAITALTFIPNVISRVIPAFKEQGFGAGIKETGKVLVQAGTDLVSYALGGALGRTIGSVIGTIICPGVGTAVGGQIGDMAGSMLIGGQVTKTVDKVIGADEETEEKLKEERADKAAQEALAYNPNTIEPKFDAQF